MTHSMELPTTNQPWNLILLMAIPVIFAEFIAVDEQANLMLHATFAAIFLVVAHVAMIFGMLNPTLLTGSAM